MGYWEQIGQDNADKREQRAALPRWRRVLADHISAALVATSWIVTAAIVLKLLKAW